MKPSPHNATQLDLLARQRDAYEDELLAEDDPPPVAPPDLPAPFLALLARALRDTPEQTEALRYYHTDLLQRRRVVVLAGRAALAGTPLEALLHTPLQLARMPRLAAALDRLARWVPVPAVDGHTFVELFAGCYYGGYAPPLGTSDPELEALLAEGLAPLELLDQRLAGPLLHELTHLHREREPLPPYLDECVAAALGARAMPALICPDAPPELPANAMFGAGWFVQVGEHLFAAFRFDPVIAAHAGRRPWTDALPPALLAAFERLAWDQYLEGRHLAFLGEAQAPDPWVKLIHLARATPSRLQELLESPHSLLGALRALPWDQVPAAPGLDLGPMRLAAQRAFLARPTLGPTGAWRVDRAPVPHHFDPATRAWIAPMDASAMAFRWVLGPIDPAALNAP